MAVVEATAYMRFASALHGGRSKKATIPLMNELPVGPAGDRGRRRDGRPGAGPKQPSGEARAEAIRLNCALSSVRKNISQSAIVIPETTTTSRDQTSEI